MKKPKLLYAGAGLLAVAILIGIIAKISGNNKLDTASQTALATSTINIATQIIGGEGSSIDQVGMSWPGEIFSPGDVEVQPQREGTIMEWKVKIGQKVRQGQVLARLSAPPATPELTRALADQAQSLARAKAQASATADFTRKNIKQLHTLRDSLQKNLASFGSTLNGLGGTQGDIVSSSQIAIKQLQSVVDVKKQNARKIMEQILTKHVQKFSHNILDPKSFSSGQLKYGLGVLNNSSQGNYEMRLHDLLNALKDPGVLPLEAAKNYMQAATKLIVGSIAAEGFTQIDLDNYRTMVNEDQINLLEAIKDYEEIKSDLAAQEVEYKMKSADYTLGQLGQEKDYAEKKKDIDQKISELEKELELSQAEVKAVAAAYYTISSALTGGLNITAPRSGIVSIILKKNGDFVNPSDSVASINSGNEKDRIVRFRIPGNITPPPAGEILTVIRPGFPGGGKKIKLAGTGLSLDGVGSFLADADFMEPVDWPTHASVRVMASQNKSGHTFASLSAVWWDASGQPHVWLVTEENRIRPQEVKTGRALGDKIEIVEGLVQGNRIVLKATSDLKTGMQLNQIQNNTDKKTEEKSEADGHGHDE